MSDPVFRAFLQRQREEGMALSQASDLLDLHPLGDRGDRYVAHFFCSGLVRRSSEIVEANRFIVGIWFPSNYLRSADPFRVLAWLAPRDIWHPNISAEAPVICVGRLVPGTSLVDLLYQVCEIITWNKVTMREDDALNRAACEWARRNGHRFPVDRRSLKRSTGSRSAFVASAPETSRGQLA